MEKNIVINEYCPKCKYNIEGKEDFDPITCPRLKDVSAILNDNVNHFSCLSFEPKWQFTKNQ